MFAKILAQKLYHSDFTVQLSRYMYQVCVKNENFS